jgi:D-aminopeptidase
MVLRRHFLPVLAGAFLPPLASQPPPRRARDLGIAPGVFAPGRWNAITDVAGVGVGHVTLIEGDAVRTGVTAIVPHAGNVFQQKVPAAIFLGNAFGKLAGSTQVEELGNLETPIVLTNTLSVAEAIAGTVEHTLAQPGNQSVRSVNAVVGETNDGYLNDIRRRAVTRGHVREAIRLALESSARPGPATEGSLGAGTGTICYGFKGGIGTSSRQLPGRLGGYRLGVLVQTNFGGLLEILGAPVGRELGTASFQRPDNDDNGDGSCMVLVATDAPLDARNLKRVAARAMLGLAVTGSFAANGSGDFVIAFSTAPENRVPFESPRTRTQVVLSNDAVSPLFQAVKEATAEAVYNSLFAATSLQGVAGHQVPALPVQQTLEILRKYRALP